MKYLGLYFLSIIFSISIHAQISGNHVYQNKYNQNSHDVSSRYVSKPVIVKDSIMLVSAEVLFNVKADSIVVTLGLSHEAKTVKEANVRINKRLDAFKAALKSMGILEEDTYVDFITQTRIYDYSVSGSHATQFIKGFEIKKNIIIKMAASAIFDKVIEAASESEIYDIVKLDYITNDTQKFYAEMMSSAASVIKRKKEIYLSLSGIELLPVAKIAAENFYAVYPSSQYKEYQAFESSEVTNEYSEARLIKKTERKNKTFYYEKTDQSGFDLVVNNASPVVDIQYVLKIQMQYDLKRK